MLTHARRSPVSLARSLHPGSCRARETSPKRDLSGHGKERFLGSEAWRLRDEMMRFRLEVDCGLGSPAPAASYVPVTFLEVHHLSPSRFRVGRQRKYLNANAR